MRLLSAHFFCYKSIIETTMNFEKDITCLVGITGAGKTSILELINKVNDDQGFNVTELSENSDTKNKFTKDEIKAEDLLQIKVVFSVDENDQKQLPKDFLNATDITFELFFDGAWTITVKQNDKELEMKLASMDDGIDQLSKYFKNIQNKFLQATSRIPNIDANIIESIIDNFIANGDSEDITTHLQILKNSLFSLPHDPQLKSELDLELSEIEKQVNDIIKKRAKDPYERVYELLPNIEYISELPNLTGNYPLDNYLNDPKSDFTFNAIGIICGFNKNAINNTRNNSVAKVNYFKDCSEKLTKEFKEYWNEIDYTLEIRLDSNDELLFLVKDEYTNNLTKTTQRSEGMRWALALFLKIKSLISSKGSSHILLFDSPATAIHDSGKEEIRKFLTKMAKNNHLQIIYTTHEKALINPWDLDKIRLVEKNTAQGTKIKTVKGDRVDSTRIQITKYVGSPAKYSLFGAPIILFFEGSSDYRFITALNECAIRNNYSHLNTDLYSIDDLNGVGNCNYMKKICTDLGLNFCFIIDGGDESENIRKQCQDDFDKYFITMSDITGNIPADIEDLIDPELYHDLFKCAHPDVQIPDFVDLNQNKKKRVDVYSEILKDKGMDIKKNDVSRCLMSVVKNQNFQDNIPLQNTLKNYVKLVEKINKKCIQNLS